MKYERLRNLREDNDLLQRHVAKILNIAERTYSHYETGKRNISIESLLTLAKFYNTSIDYLVGLTDEKSPYPRAKSHK
ncbi:helix-turn-helix domain-containing protein [Maledivibacter halophilus]|uniref:DNA-binding transcriptional regulator, XRE-family HTH domain n=1 Tax=Maledivibacter halophilus TaxID=36842 RepID=A0A1T5I9S3_9FIRM|nr:helix-turn-helix transcriptional regulator [Maledivibacter halophilus]SKC35783.1 DNA-binding transcriptional regulator, XRE-family HTH domain [Maledivibacter halophilus]